MTEARIFRREILGEHEVERHPTCWQSSVTHVETKVKVYAYEFGKQVALYWRHGQQDLVRQESVFFRFAGAHVEIRLV